MEESNNDILITANFIRDINATIYEYFNDFELRPTTINNLFNELDRKIKRKSAVDARKYANKFLNNIFGIQKIFFDWAIARTTQQEEELYEFAIRKKKEILPSINNGNDKTNTQENEPTSPTTENDKTINDETKNEEGSVVGNRTKSYPEYLYSKKDTTLANAPKSLSEISTGEYKEREKVRKPSLNTVKESNNSSVVEENVKTDVIPKPTLNKKLALKDIQERLKLITPSEYTKLEYPDVDINPIVLDIGSYACKVGFIRKTQPEFLLNSLLGVLIDNQSKKPIYFGLKALKYSSRSTLYSIIDNNGKICVTSDYMEEFLKYIMVQLKVDKYVCPESNESRPKGVRMILNDLCMDSSFKDKMLSLLFNRFNVTYVAFLNPVELTLPDPVSTGVIVDIGDSTTKIVPICRGQIISGAQYCYDIAGNAITQYLVQLLETRYKYKFNAETPGHGLEMARKIKEKFCYVAQKFIEERSDVIGQYVELPNGQLIIMDMERIQCPEILFQPNLIGRNQIKSLPCLIERVINKCEAIHHDELYTNIIITGGSSLFNGLQERIQKDLTILIPHREIVVKSFPQRKSTWISTAIYDNKRYNWISKKEWRIAHKKS